MSGTGVESVKVKKRKRASKSKVPEKSCLGSHPHPLETEEESQLSHMSRPAQLYSCLAPVLCTKSLLCVFRHVALPLFAVCACDIVIKILLLMAE